VESLEFELARAMLRHDCATSVRVEHHQMAPHLAVVTKAETAQRG